MAFWPPTSLKEKSFSKHLEGSLGHSLLVQSNTHVRPSFSTQLQGLTAALTAVFGLLEACRTLSTASSQQIWQATHFVGGPIVPRVHIKVPTKGLAQLMQAKVPN